MPRKNKYQASMPRLRVPTFYNQLWAQDKADELVDELPRTERAKLVRIAAKDSPSDGETLKRVSAALYAAVAIEVGMGRPFKDYDSRLRFLRKVLRGNFAPKDSQP